MQQQFPHAGLELVQRYEQELGRVHHLQTKAMLQKNTIDDLSRKIEDGALAHLARLNSELKTASELQDAIHRVEDETRQLERQIASQKALVERMMVQASQSRLRFAHNFVQRQRRSNLNAVAPPVKDRPDAIDPNDIFADFDAVTRAFADDVLTPSPEELSGSELLAELRDDHASPEAQRKAAFVLLELAAKNVKAHREFCESAEANGILLPHEVAAKRRILDEEMKSMRTLVSHVALGRPAAEAQLCRMLGLQVDADDNDAVSASTVSAPTLLRYSRPQSAPVRPQSKVSASDELPFGTRFANHIPTPPAAATLKSEINELKDQIAAYELAMAAPSAATRVRAIQEVDALEFQHSRQVEPPQTSVARSGHVAAAIVVPPRPPSATSRLGWRSNVAPRLQASDRYRAAALRCGATGAAQTKIDYSPHVAAPFKFKTHAGLDAAVKSEPLL